MEGMMETIEEYLRLHHGVIRAPLAYVIRKTMIVQTFGDYSEYATTDGKRIARILQLPQDKNKLLEYEIDKRTLYDILDQICKGTNFYSYVKQHKSKRDRRGEIYAINSRWLDLSHVNVREYEAEADA